jgi:hypothetical protein
VPMAAIRSCGVWSSTKRSLALARSGWLISSSGNRRAGQSARGPHVGSAAWAWRASHAAFVNALCSQ